MVAVTGVITKSENQRLQNKAQDKSEQIAENSQKGHYY